MSVPMSNHEPTTITVRQAALQDIAALAAFLEPFVLQGKLLPRTAAELEALLPGCFIAESSGELVGCAALEIYSAKLAELRSLAVAPDYRGQGVGKRLVEACIELARQKHVLEVMAITSAEEFFKSCGFDFTLPGEKKALFLQTRDV